METRGGTTRHIWSPRPKENRETVRQQQRELRRIRQRARRESMSEEQLEKRRERGRENYLQRKIKKHLNIIKGKDVPAAEPMVEEFFECTTAEHIVQQSKRNHAYQCQQRENLQAQELDQTERRKMVDPRNNRLTHVKRLARNGNRGFRSPRLIHVKRQARMVSRGVGESGEKGTYFQRKANFSDSITHVQEHAQILLDISRMNGHSSTTTFCSSGRSFGVNLSKGAMDKSGDLLVSDESDGHGDSDETGTDSEDSTSDSDEVLAFLSDLSAKNMLL